MFAVERYDIDVTVADESCNFRSCRLYFDFMAGNDENHRVEKVWIDTSDWTAGRVEHVSLKTPHKLGRLYKMNIGLLNPDDDVKLLIKEVRSVSVSGKNYL